MALIKKGCGCKTGCITARCKCNKSGNYCGPGCKCVRCCNLPSSASPDPNTATIEVDEDDSTSNAEDSLEREVNEIMNEIFGEHPSSAEAESNSDSVLSTLSTDIEYMQLDT